MGQLSTENSTAFTGSDTLELRAKSRLLAVDLRRVILEYMQSRGEPIQLEALAKQLANRTDTEGSIADLAIVLHHHHLPLMKEIGVLAYDYDTRMVQPISR